MFRHWEARSAEAISGEGGDCEIGVAWLAMVFALPSSRLRRRTGAFRRGQAKYAHACAGFEESITSGEEWYHLDDFIFDGLKLAQGERDAVYEAVIHLVETRLKKAGSV